MSILDQAMADTASTPLSFRGPAPARIVVGYGFWLFLLSDVRSSDLSRRQFINDVSAAR